MFILSDTGSKGSKYAVFFLCFGSDYYIIGLLCALQAHREILARHKYNVELVVMCDEYIYKFKDQLEKYCDRLVCIKMIALKDHYKATVIEKYASPWLDYIINKWHCLYFDEYEKLMFSDIDMIPASSGLYGLFDKYTAPFVFGGRDYSKGCWNDVYYGCYNNRKQYSDFYSYTRDGKFYIDASQLIITPSRELHKEYYEFVTKLDYTNKRSANKYSTIDETSLYYFISNVKGFKYECFRKEDLYAVPWSKSYVCKDQRKVDTATVQNALIFNYRATIKSWVKPLPLMWPEEFIWKILEKQVISGDNLLKALSVRNTLQMLLKMYNGDKHLEVINRKQSITIKDLTEKLISDGFNLQKDIFSSQAYDALNNNIDSLLSLTKQLNNISNDANIIRECCGIIKSNQFEFMQ